MTTIAVSPATWMAVDLSLATNGTSSTCSVAIEVLRLTSGRLFLNAVTVSARRELLVREMMAQNMQQALWQVAANK